MNFRLLPLVITVGFVLRLVPFASCQNNSTDEFLNELGNSVFPVITLGKDTTSLYYANLSFGDPIDAQQLRVDIAQPYTWLISKINDSKSAVSLNDGFVYDFSFIDSIEVNASATMDTMNFTEIQYTNGSDVTETHSVDLSSNLVVGPNYLAMSNISFFETAQASFYTKGSLGLGGRITDGSSTIDSTKFDDTFFFLDRLTDLGIIKTPSYSLWFGADTVPYNRLKLASGTMTDCGQLLLGAVDPSLFVGTLRAFKMIPFIDPVTEMQSDSYPILPLGTIYINSATGNSLNMTSEEFSEPVLLNSRYSTSYLPIDAIVQIAVQVGATFVESLNKWLVACSVANLDVELDFTFDDIAITVPLADFLVTTYDPASNTSLRFSNGDEACFLSMVSRSKTGYNILGGPFLKNVYMAVDINDSMMAIAQAQRASSPASSSTSESSTTSSSSSTSPAQLRAISSGYIPYAQSRNESSSLKLFPSQVPSLTTYVPDLFTGTVDSNGLISTGRSFYGTSRSTSTSRSSDTTFESLVITSTSKSSKPAENAGSVNVAPICASVLAGGPRRWMAYLLTAISGTIPLEILI